MALEFVVNILVTRLLGPEGRGVLAMANSTSGLVSQFGLLGQNAANVYYGARRRIPLGPLLVNSLLLCLLVGVLFGGVLVAGYPQVADWLDVSDSMLLLLVLAVPLLMGQQLIQGLLLGRELVYSANHLEIQVRLLQLLMVGVVVFVGLVQPEIVFALGLLASLLAIALGVRVLTKQVPGFQVGRPSLLVFRRTLGYGGKAYTASLLSFAVMRVDVFLINHFLGLEAVGLYAAGLAIVNAIYVLPSTLSQLALARLSNMRERWSRLVFAGRLAALVSLVMLPVVVIAWLCADGFFLLVYGEAFRDGALAFVWLLPGVFIWSVEANLRKLYSSDGFANWILYAWALAFVVNLMLNVLLIPLYGIIGAAMASSLALGLVGFWTFVVYGRDLLAGLRGCHPREAVHGD